MQPSDLAGSLRGWRDRLDPAVVGVVPGRRRRVPGLRRQELAALAGLSVEYLARLEQGRAANPSASVLAPLARALRLTTQERDHLFRLAGHHPPVKGAADRHVSPSLQRIVGRLSDTAVMVIDVEWNVVLANPLAVALLGHDATTPGAAGNALRRHFSDRPSRVLRTPEHDRAFEAQAVGDLRLSLGRYPGDPGLRSLVDDLSAGSQRFRALWSEGGTGIVRNDRKTIRHPDVGDVDVDCDVLTDATSSLRLVTYSAAPDTPDAQALALLGAIGTQELSRPA